MSISTDVQISRCTDQQMADTQMCRFTGWQLTSIRRSPGFADSRFRKFAVSYKSRHRIPKKHRVQLPTPNVKGLQISKKKCTKRSYLLSTRYRPPFKPEGKGKRKTLKNGSIAAGRSSGKDLLCGCVHFAGSLKCIH